MIKAALYCRVSTEEQAREGFSIAAQKKTLASFCDIKGWEVFRVYADEGISGKDTRRPAFQKMLKDAENYLFDVVLVWKINRFSRKNADLLNISEYLKNYNVNLVSCSEQFDASTPAGKLMLSMLGSIGEFERDTIVENIKSGMKERAEQGLFNGGKVLGYDCVSGRLEVNDNEALTVRRIFNLYLNGFNYNNIKDILISENRKTKNNCDFNISSIKRILENPIYAGYISYNRTKKVSGNRVKNDSYIISQGSHMPIISKGMFEKAGMIIASKRQSYSRDSSFILAGLLKCPSCGGKMTGSTRYNKKGYREYRYYICSNYKNKGPSVCRPNSINASMAEDEVIKCICSAISDPLVIHDIYGRISNMRRSAVFEEDLKAQESELGKARKLHAKYIKLFETDKLDNPEFTDKIAQLDSEISIIRNRIAFLNQAISSAEDDISFERVSTITKNFRNVLASLDYTTKKRLVSSIIKEILINPVDSSLNINMRFLPKGCTRYTGHNIQSDIDPRNS